MARARAAALAAGAAPTELMQAHEGKSFATLQFSLRCQGKTGFQVRPQHTQILTLSSLLIN